MQKLHEPRQRLYKKYVDVLTVMVEVDEQYFSDEIRKLDDLKKKIGNVIKQAIGVSVRVKLVEPKSIERSEGKYSGTTGTGRKTVQRVFHECDNQLKQKSKAVRI